MNATFAGCAAIALWAFLALLTRGAADVPPLELTGLAFTVSAMLGLAVVAARGRLGALRQKPLAWAHGVGGLAGYHALYFAALDLAPPAEAGLLNYGWPLLIVLFSAPLLGLRLNRNHALGSLLSAAGCLLLLLARDSAAPRGDLAWLGDLLATAAAIVWALYSVLSRRMEAVATEAVAGFCAASAVLSTLAAVVFERPVWPGGAAWLAILALGAGPVGGAFFLWDIGMKRGDPRLLGTLAYATPVLSTLLLCLGGYAPWSPTLGLAALLVAAGGLIASRGAKRRPRLAD
jgi:drug/metabolite transporter (DMT)-like permease